MRTVKSRKVKVFWASVALIALIALSVPICRCPLCVVENRISEPRPCECKSLAATMFNAVRENLGNVQCAANDHAAPSSKGNPPNLSTYSRGSESAISRDRTAAMTKAESQGE